MIVIKIARNLSWKSWGIWVCVGELRLGNQSNNFDNGESENAAQNKATLPTWMTHHQCTQKVRKFTPHWKRWKHLSSFHHREAGIWPQSFLKRVLEKFIKHSKTHYRKLNLNRTEMEKTDLENVPMRDRLALAWENKGRRMRELTWHSGDDKSACECVCFFSGNYYFHQKVIIN